MTLRPWLKLIMIRIISLPISIPWESNHVTRRGCISLFSQFTTFFKGIDAILWSTISVGIISVVLPFAFGHGWNKNCKWLLKVDLMRFRYIYDSWDNTFYILNIPVVVVGASVVSVKYENFIFIIIIIYLSMYLLFWIWKKFLEWLYVYYQ